MNADIICKLNQAAAAVSAHRTGFAIGIVIDHFKIVAIFVVEQHEAVGSDTEPAVTDEIDLLLCELRIFAASVVKNYKIIPRALVFMKVDVHLMLI